MMLMTRTTHRGLILIENTLREQNKLGQTGKLIGKDKFANPVRHVVAMLRWRTSMVKYDYA